MEEVVFSRLGDELESQGPDNGSSRSFMIPRLDDIVTSTVEFDINPNCPRRNVLVEDLRSFTNAGFPLLDFQIQAIANTVYRPSIIDIDKTVTRRNRRGPNQNYRIHAKVACGSSDIGTAVVNDLMTGSGKTIMAMVASIYFATHRAHEVVAREQILLREQRTMNWSSRMGANDSPRSFTNSIIVMASDKVVAQWEEATKEACAILGIHRIHINRNPTMDAFQGNSENVSVNLFTSAMNLRTCFPSDNGFVPCVIVDEYVVKATHNVVTRHAQDTPIYGRLILISADAGDTHKTLLGSRKNSLMRSVVANGNVDNSSLKNDVRLSTCLLACSILPSKARDDAHEFLFLGLNGHIVEKYNIKFDSPIWGAEMEGYTVPEIPEEIEKLGVRGLSTVKTVDEFFEAVYSRLLELSGQHVTFEEIRTRGELSRLYQAAKAQVLEECPVCLDPLKSKDQLALLCPCWHIVCKHCIRRCLHARDTCPKCRASITGIMELRPEPKPKLSLSDDFEGCRNFEDYLRKYLPWNPVPLEACSAILNASAAALLAKMENPIFRILIVGPSTGFGNSLWKSLVGKHRDAVSVVQLKVEGNKRKRTSMGYEEQLKWFKSREGEGEKVKVLCTHENVNFAEDVVGLDLHEVDAICHVGGGITGRRLGRATRIQRVVGGKVGTSLRLFNLLPN